ncbi:hypothetical protein PI124_g19647 [Phytophthora idaei]|nr:hypothetical protein PI126_g20439 [Phytophthora idaei]KAG3235317.1 hypothetical protein PI124_g19647 [Phytophthora idaei]
MQAAVSKRDAEWTRTPLSVEKPSYARPTKTLARSPDGTPRVHLTCAPTSDECAEGVIETESEGGKSDSPAVMCDANVNTSDLHLYLDADPSMLANPTDQESDK